MQTASFLLYLSNVEEGGETMFPFEVFDQILCLFVALQFESFSYW
jgi:hypothetical protein